ncbi:Translocator protein [Sesamum alatum]|uniref:Translocator protein n=1 Tax=Sesamum alatum TaxID=300844 RepID=A0AAE1XUA7_9LAMI|nr:Translocator protein [Sesamum alatum]
MQIYQINTLYSINSLTSPPSSPQRNPSSLDLHFHLPDETLIMASQDLRHRTKQEEESEPEVIKATATAGSPGDAKQKRTGTARRGLRSLSVAVAFPLSLALLDIFYFGSSNRYRSLHKPFYFPPLWALHSACLATSFLSGLSAWLVWADGGFHRKPTALILYLGQLAISLGWYPVVFGAGAIRVGLVLCGALFGLLVGCTMIFRNMNPIAGDLVKACLVWAVLLAVVNVRLVYH